VITLSLNLILAPPPELTVTATIDPANAFAETEEGNNTDSETTTVSGTVCLGCVDLVSALLTATPEPVSSGGSVTYTYVLINAGDEPTTLSPAQFIAFFDFFVAGHTSFSISTNNPLITCTTINPLSTTTKFNNCTGNLGGGQGVTITATIGGVTGDGVTATALADPANVVSEVNEGNNVLTETVDIP
jgi:hypothetical protein